MTGSEMAKAGLLEQNRLSGANRNTLIAGGIMANTAEIFNFPVPDAAQKEPRVADLDDGYTRIANELLEAVMLAGLTQHQLLVFLAVMRKTYGFNKKLDWVSNEQLSELTGILPHKCSAAKSVLVKRGILIQSGRNIGINNVVSEWSTLPESGKKNKVYLKEVNLPESGKKSLPKSGKTSGKRYSCSPKACKTPVNFSFKCFFSKSCHKESCSRERFDLEDLNLDALFSPLNCK